MTLACLLSGQRLQASEVDKMGLVRERGLDSKANDSRMNVRNKDMSEISHFLKDPTKNK